MDEGVMQVENDSTRNFATFGPSKLWPTLEPEIYWSLFTPKKHKNPAARKKVFEKLTPKAPRLHPKSPGKIAELIFQTPLQKMSKTLKTPFKNNECFSSLRSSFSVVGSEGRSPGVIGGGAGRCGMGGVERWDGSLISMSKRREWKINTPKEPM
jgi:hypothetical protein